MEYSETKFYVLDHSDNQNGSAYFLECQTYLFLSTLLLNIPIFIEHAGVEPIGVRLLYPQDFDRLSPRFYAKKTGIVKNYNLLDCSGDF